MHRIFSLVAGIGGLVAAGGCQVAPQNPSGAETPPAVSPKEPAMSGDDFSPIFAGAERVEGRNQRYLLISFSEDARPAVVAVVEAFRAKNSEVLDRDLVIEATPAKTVRGGSMLIELVGRDGGVKLRRIDAPVTTEEIFALIDSMPMRQREMRP